MIFVWSGGLFSIIWSDFSTEMGLYWFKKLRKLIFFFIGVWILWIEISFHYSFWCGQIQCLPKQLIWTLIFNNKCHFLTADSSECCLTVFFLLVVLFSELRCGSLKYRDLAFISLHLLHLLRYHFRYLCLTLTIILVPESIRKEKGLSLIQPLIFLDSQKTVISGQYSSWGQ